MVQNVNFMGKIPTDKIVTVAKDDAKNFFAHSTPIEKTAEKVASKLPGGVTEAELKAYIDSKLPILEDNTAALKELNQKLAADSYTISHGNPIQS